MATPAFGQDFGGLRVEARAGWDNVGVDLEATGGIPRGEFSEDASTISYGAEVGYDVAFGDAVVGAYAGADFAQADGCGSVLGNDRACFEAERNITVGARVGLAVIPQALLYAKGGYSNGRVSARYDNFGDLFGEIEDSESRTGYHVGIGGELGIGRFYAKAEYVHTRYSEFELNTLLASGTGSVNRNQVLAGVGLRF
jgi:outer membrane immunogenic protein